jgi:cellulose synthase/poly-beta-1,6-N-acetylglucosamine synthase-like glycosyltransferase
MTWPFLDVVSGGILLLTLVPLAYLLLLAAASVRQQAGPSLEEAACLTRFLVLIPAHDEARVVQTAIRCVREADYPGEFVYVVVIADHCSDETASRAREAGAHVLERNEGARSGKGAALSWFGGSLSSMPPHDAVAVLDADTRVAPHFFRAMDAQLSRGESVVQGQHAIGNPCDGLYSALSWALLKIDNRFQNLGRTNLGLSAKHMGDSICLRADVFRQCGWDDSLTEDYEMRLRLLLGGIRIAYEPRAIGFGEAPRSWKTASTQRRRWLRGTRDAGGRFARRLLLQGLARRDGPLIDAALQVYLPSYSTLTLLSVSALGAQFWVDQHMPTASSAKLLTAWASVAALLFLYPLAGLALERAPLSAFRAILLGPFFVLWRSGLALAALARRDARWISTPHGQ